MEACCEQQSNGWCLLLPSEADGRPMERVAFPSLETAQQALRLVALHAALTAGQPSDEVQRLRAELEVSLQTLPPLPPVPHPVLCLRCSALFTALLPLLGHSRCTALSTVTMRQWRS